MKPGWPFDTKELAKRRAEQRRDLRLIDSWIVERATKDLGPPVAVSEAARGLVEETVRDEADRLRGDVPPDVLDSMARFEVAEAANRFGAATFNERSGAAEQFGMGFGQRQKEMADATRHTKWSSDELKPVTSYVVALIIADEVADDGYRDPRLPTPT